MDEVVVLYIGPQREQSGRSAGFGGGGVNGGWPLRGGKREAMGQCRFNGETKGGDSLLRFNSFQVREGDRRRCTAWQRRPGRWRVRRCLMKVATLGSLTGWAHLSVRGRRRPNRTSSEREATVESDKWSRRRPNQTSGAGRLRKFPKK
jgi:hypothetical protein